MRIATEALMLLVVSILASGADDAVNVQNPQHQLVLLLSADPASFQAWMQAGKQLAGLGSTEMALDSFKTASRINHGSPAPHEASASILLSMPPPAPSPPLPCLLLALRRGTNDPQTFYSLGLHIPSILNPPPSTDSDSDTIHSLPPVLSSVSHAIKNRASGAKNLFFAGESNILSSTPMLEKVSSGEPAAWIHLASATCFSLAAEADPLFMEAFNNAGSSLISYANTLPIIDGSAIAYREAHSLLTRASNLRPDHPTPLLPVVRLAQKTAYYPHWDVLRARVRHGIAKALESRTGLDQWVGGGSGLMPWQAAVFGPGPEEVLSLVRFLADEVMSLLKGATVPRGGGWEIPLPPSLQPPGGGITGSGGGGGGSVGGPSRIRVGYLSCSGFMGNTTTSNFVRTVFSDTDRARVSNVCFARGSPTYGGGTDGSFSQTYIRENCEDYRDHTRMSVYETASEVSQIGVHVLVDLTGWTLYPCVEVLGLRSAPVQVTWHGYGGSLGRTLADYIGTDPVVSPPEYQGHYDERLLFTHGTYMLSAPPPLLNGGGTDAVTEGETSVNGGGTDAVTEGETSVNGGETDAVTEGETAGDVTGGGDAVSGGGGGSVSGKADDPVRGRDAANGVGAVKLGRRDLGLANGVGAVKLGRQDLGLELERLGSGLAWFDQDGRNTSVGGFGPDETILCSWNNINKGDPGTLQAWMSVLRSLPNTRLWLLMFDPSPPPNVALAAREAGVDPSRILWSKFFPRNEEFRIKRNCQLFLDWPVFNGHTTGSECLWAGVPLLTASTDEFSGRVGASLLTRGVPGGAPLVSRGLSDYEGMAIALAGPGKKSLEVERARLAKLLREGEMLCNRPWVRSWESGLFRAVEIALGDGARHHISPGPVPQVPCA